MGIWLTGSLIAPPLCDVMSVCPTHSEDVGVKGVFFLTTIPAPRYKFRRVIAARSERSDWLTPLVNNERHTSDKFIRKPENEIVINQLTNRR